MQPAGCRMPAASTCTINPAEAFKILPQNAAKAQQSFPAALHTVVGLGLPGDAGRSSCAPTFIVGAQPTPRKAPTMSAACCETVDENNHRPRGLLDCCDRRGRQLLPLPAVRPGSSHSVAARMASPILEWPGRSAMRLSTAGSHKHPSPCCARWRR